MAEACNGHQSVEVSNSLISFENSSFPNQIQSSYCGSSDTFANNFVRWQPKNQNAFKFQNQQLSLCGFNNAQPYEQTVYPSFNNQFFQEHQNQPIVVPGPQLNNLHNSEDRNCFQQFIPDVNSNNFFQDNKFNSFVPDFHNKQFQQKQPENSPRKSIRSSLVQRTFITNQQHNNLLELQMIRLVQQQQIPQCSFDQKVPHDSISPPNQTSPKTELSFYNNNNSNLPCSIIPKEEKTSQTSSSSCQFASHASVGPDNKSIVQEHLLSVPGPSGSSSCLQKSE